MKNRSAVYAYSNETQASCEATYNKSKRVAGNTEYETRLYASGATWTCAKINGIPVVPICAYADATLCES